MPPIVLYFNELCSKCNPPTSSEEHHWIAAVDQLSMVIDRVFTIRKDSHISFPLDSWFVERDGQTLCDRFRRQLTKDRYLRLLSRIRRCEDEHIPMSSEVRFLEKSAVGLTLADVAASAWTHGWAVSLPFPDSPWLQHSVAAERFVLTDQGILDGPVPCTVNHLSKEAHVTQ